MTLKRNLFRKPTMNVLLLLALLHFGHSEEPTHMPDVGAATEPDYSGSVELIEGKHPHLLNCFAIELNNTDYIMYRNGSAYVPAYGIMYDSTRYLHDESTDVLTVCYPSWVVRKYVEEHGDFPKYHITFYYVTLVGMIISTFCLALHLIAFGLVPELRNLPGCNIASLCVALIFGYIAWMFTNVDQSTNPTLCTLIAYIAYYFLLSSFMWMAVMAFDVFRSLWRATGQFRVATKKFMILRFMCYALFAWGVPMVFAMIVLVLDKAEKLPDMFRPEMGRGNICWFGNRKPLLIFFATPVFLITFANIIFFGVSAFIIHTNRMKTGDSQKTDLRKSFTMHYRLAMIMGLTWIFGFAPTIKSYVVITLFTVANCFQGLFIFLACTCTTKVKKQLRKRFQFLTTRRESTQPAPATFQSYLIELSVSTEGKKSFDSTTSNLSVDNEAFEHDSQTQSA